MPALAGVFAGRRQRAVTHQAAGARNPARESLDPEREQTIEDMMRTKLIRVAVGAAMFAATIPALAQTNSGAAPTPPTPEQMLSMTPQQRQDLHRQLQSLPPEQRKAYREQMHAQFAGMSPEQRQQFHEQIRVQRKAAWDALTPEQKTAKKAEAEKRRAEHKAKVEAFVKTLTPAQKKAFDDLRDRHGMNARPE
jgi:Spy/CpxP family protein refolding chaperone